MTKGTLSANGLDGTTKSSVKVTDAKCDEVFPNASDDAVDRSVASVSRDGQADAERKLSEQAATIERIGKMATEDDSGAWNAHQELIRQITRPAGASDIASEASGQTAAPKKVICGALCETSGGWVYECKLPPHENGRHDWDKWTVPTAEDLGEESD